MNRVEARNLATRLSATDTESALSVAGQINDAWFGCQSLAWVARFAPEDQVIEIVKFALNKASQAKDPFNYVGAAAWAVRALIERGHLKEVDEVVVQLLHRAPDIVLYASRSEALFLLFQAVRPCPLKMWHKIFEALVEASSPIFSWRQGRNLRDALLMIAGEYPKMAEEVLNNIADEKLKRHIQRRFDAKEFVTPRQFFWNKDV